MSIYESFSPQERAILAKRAERAARSIDDQGVGDPLSVLIVSVGRESYAIPTNLIAGVYEDAWFVPVPCTPAFVAGITNIRGHILTVLGLASFLNIASDESSLTLLVVTSHEDLRVAFAVAEVGTTQTVSAASFVPIPDSASLAQHSYLKGLLADGTALLDVEAVLSEALQRIGQG